MGRIKTKLTKRVTKDLMKSHGEDVRENFDENKGVVSKYLTVPSKKIRNIIAGYATRMAKRKKAI
jgi:small subunit ribosomal protein S17e